MRRILSCPWMVLIITCSSFGMVKCNEKRLYKDLKERYSSVGVEGRPVIDPRQPVNVRFEFELIQLLAVDEKAQTITTIVWISYTWKDEYLTWNASEYGDVTTISFPPDNIWIPDIACHSKSNKDVTLKKPRADVNSSGIVYVGISTVLETRCAIDISDFPADVQTCHFEFFSWSYDDTRQKIHSWRASGFNIDLKFYMNSTEWELIESSGSAMYNVFDPKYGEYTGVKFTIRIKRNPTFYNLVIVKPAVMLSVMTIFIFLMPPSTVDRYTYGAGLFAAFFFLLIIVSDVTPHGTVKAPGISLYIYVNKIMVLVAMAISTVVIWIHQYNDNNQITSAKRSVQSSENVPDDLNRRRSAIMDKLPLIIDRGAAVCYLALEFALYFMFVHSL